MEKYVVSARKYRPTKFDDVIGQNHVTTTLKNAIKNNKVAQSLLFCGPRGVGKTTCARILANEINGFNINDPLDSSNNLNIYELDAASNNSVDDIRSLIDQVRYVPQAGKYKVYIIDEVHMLSNAAFNAFLKTLEEPPSYAIFILATTEKNKVIPTILSRCQIYDFNRIEISDIKSKLIDILNSEKIDFEDGALHIIAQKSDGALRDALSTLDLIKTFSKNSKITIKDVTKNLNIIDNEYLFKITELLYNADKKNSILTHNELVLRGFESYNLLIGLSSHFRNLLLSHDEKLLDIMEESDDDKIRFNEQAKKLDIEFIEDGLDILNKFEINYKLSSNPKIHTEIALVKLCSLNNPPTDSEPNLSKPIKSEKINKEEVPIKEAPKVTEEKKKSTKDTPNLKTLLNKNQENISKEKSKKEIDENKITFSDENFKNEISNFIDITKKKKSEIAILKKEISINNKTIIFHLDNELESSIFDDIKNKLQSFLKKKFKEEISIEKKVTIKEKEKTIYTNKDKFEYLTDKNKNLIELKNRLGLDYEF